MEFCWNLHGEDYTDIVHQTQLIEKCGFDNVLIVSLQQAMDPWILATHLCGMTKKLRFLVAQNTNSVSPSYTVKSANTLNLITNNRIDLNIVTGSSPLELGKEGNFDRHMDRYRRSEEFVQAVSLANSDSLTFQGQYYRYNQLNIVPKAPPPRIFFAGSSNEAVSIAAKYADYHVMYADDFASVKKTFAEVKAKAYEAGRSIKCGILIDVIARKTSSGAWQAANELSAGFSRADKKMKSLFLKNIDSAGIAQHKKLLTYDDYRVGRNLWSGIAQVSTAHGLSIVGNYEEVVRTIQHYHELGADYFLLSGLAGDHEIERIGEYVIPYLKPKG